ncbi:MarR family winged helix-turn-helix transcriptional regulator [Paenibacillus lutrae]|uniref:MarR family transcriptional regulator n=1 Tax=Paenibacillus lutrae TaxID=2078573 RepID=A0A7X3FEA5_9BACL|nr:MarR family transcriptional regulator [Paenibacillus lutrae]MVO98136.1 MarR family transcriptional regulator [Paenibacillus lutrae]
MFNNSPNPLSIDVIHLLVRTTHAIQREFDTQLSALDTPYAITGPRLRLLSVVSKSGSIRMNELASKLGIRARTVTDFVDALEQEQLLIRVQDPKDRRATLIELTELAQASINQVLSSQNEIADKLLANFEEHERKQFFDSLLKLVENKDLSNPCEGTLK